jgi:hypothetical protein
MRKLLREPIRAWLARERSRYRDSSLFMGLWLGIQYLAFIVAFIIGISIDKAYPFGWQTPAFVAAFVVVWATFLEIVGGDGGWSA